MTTRSMKELAADLQSALILLSNPNPSKGHIKGVYSIVSLTKDALKAQNRQKVNEEWMDCPCGCGCVFLGHDGSLVTCPKHQTEGEKRLLRESVEVRSSSTMEPR